MVTFGKKLRECREAKGFSQQDLAKKIGSVHTVVGRYERDEMIPSIEVVKKLADVLGTAVGYLVGEAQVSTILKDPQMMKRFNAINELDADEKHCVYSFLDAYIAKHRMQSFLK